MLEVIIWEVIIWFCSILRRIWSYITEGLYITIYRMHN